MKASDLIKSQQCRGAAPPPSAAALKELAAVIEYNDSVPWNRRVSAAKAIEMLNSLGWTPRGVATFHRMIREQLGRSYGSK